MKNKMLNKLGALTMIGAMALGSVSVYAGEGTAVIATQPTRIIGGAVADFNNFENLEDWQVAELEALRAEASLIHQRISEITGIEGIGFTRVRTLAENALQEGVHRFTMPANIALARGASLADVQMLDIENFVSQISRFELSEDAPKFISTSARPAGSFVTASNLGELFDFELSEFEISELGLPEGDRIRISERIEIADGEKFRMAIPDINIEQLGGHVRDMVTLRAEGLEHLTEEDREELKNLHQELSEISMKILEMKQEFGIIDVAIEKLDGVRAESISARIQAVRAN